MSNKLRIAIIGGGAAGFFAAIKAKQRKPEAEVFIYEKNKKVLAKVEITGGGRCNLTNTFDDISDLKHAYPRGHKLMKRLFKTFDYHSTFEWFEDNGVPLVVQEDQCVFPKSQDSHSITDCLITTAKRLGVKIITNYRLVGITEQADEKLQLEFVTSDKVGDLKNDRSQRKQLLFDRVAITTGGHPQVHHFSHLSALGHKIEFPVPSLFTFNIAEKALRELMGTVVDTVITSIPGTKYRCSGSLLITHWGMSGPAILKLSSHAAHYLSDNNYQVRLSVNWINETNRTVVDENIQEFAVRNSQKQLSNARPFGLPSRLWIYLISKLGWTVDKKWCEIGKKMFNVLIETLTNDSYLVDGKGSFKEEFVTCGGVSLDNINMNTLESKVCPHLFFAGEVLDIDAITGGFNLQAAWTTGYVVGQNIVE